MANHKNREQGQPPDQQSAQPVKRLIKSVRCSSMQLDEQDNTIERMEIDGYSYMESLVLPGTGEIIMRFKRK